MKASIRLKLFVGVTGLIVIFVFLTLFINVNFLNDYYIYEKKKTLIESYKNIDKLYEGDISDVVLELERLEGEKNISVIISDSDLKRKYDSIREFEKRPQLPQPPNVSSTSRINTNDIQLKVRLKNYTEGKILVEINKDMRLNTKFIHLVARLNNKDYIFIKTPLAAINESSSIANKFLLFVGIFTICLGSISVFVFAKSFTRPILKLNEIAQGMANMDFTKKYDARTGDEVDQLGNSINMLSDKLDSSISELKDANDRLKADIEKERSLDRMRKEFVSNVSHELKTPIALIQGYAEGLKVNVNEDAENKDFYCEVIIDEAKRMNSLVKSLLDLSGIESGSLRLELKTFYVNDFVERILEKYGPIFEEKSIKSIYISDKDFFVEGDILRLEQVLMNYINNAINYIDYERQIIISTEDMGKKLRISVFNSGKKIPEVSLEKIWDSFYKVDKARTRSYGGAGLGLSIVRSIMELHNCGYGVVNSDGGVVFWFEINKEQA